ncbi:MAG: TonB-dependent receptor [Gemmatimonadota bacterium]
MSRRVSRHRPRPRSLRSGAFFVLALAAGAPLDVRAQDTIPPPREERRDTFPRDTVPADTLGPPPPALIPLGPVGPAGWRRGVWEWDRDALRRLPDLSVLQLLERVPGVVPVRADIANQPEGGAVFGTAGNAIRYIVDGFELDPLGTPTFDPSRFPLLALERVRIERRVSGATVWIETLSPEDRQPRSIIEAGTGDYDVNLFRGMFLAPGVFGGPLALGFERLASDGLLGGSNHLATWLKWTWVRDSAGVQIEYRRSDMDRGGVGTGLDGVRTDWAVRARHRLGPVTGEAYAGAAGVEDERGALVLREGTPHTGVRLRTALVAPVPLEARAAFRLRDQGHLPTQEAEAELYASPLPYLALEGQVVRKWWDEGTATARWRGRARVGPFGGVWLFGEVSGGTRAAQEVPSIRFSPLDSLLLTSHDRCPTLPAVCRLAGHWSPVEQGGPALRAGVDFHRGGFQLGVAAIRTSAETVPGFGLAFEPPGLGTVGGEATGFEAVARVPTGWDPLNLEAWYVGMDAPSEWLYLPEHHWRAGLVYHHLPLRSGNLEIFARAEHVFRGAMTTGVPPAVPDPGDPGQGTILDAAPPALTRVGSYRATNLELSIRVVTVRAFLRWQNIMHRQLQRDLPGFRLPGQHVLYGVKWEFLN